MTSNNRKPSITLVQVTPAVAEELLGKNVRNRNVREKVVRAYGRDMRADNWLVTGEAIKIAEDGDLIDGQHRLLAVIWSGVTVPMFVAKGIRADAQRVMDTGAKRSPGDMLKLDGHANAHHLAAAARFAITYLASSASPSRTQRDAVTNSELSEFLENNQDFPAAVAAVLHYRRTIDIPMSVTGVTWWLLAQLDPEACETFFHSIANNQTSGAGDPRNTLIQRLATARRNNESLTQTAQLSMLFRAWNHWRKGLPLAKLQVYSREGGEVQIPNPIP